MRIWLAAVVLAASASVAAAQAVDQTLQLTFHDDGTVSLSARNVTTSDILYAWANECHCLVVNGNRLAGPATTVPIVFERAPQAVVLRALLRQAGGYVLTPQRAGASGPSQYETIYILPTSAAAAPAPYVAVPPPVTFQPVPPPTAGAPDDEIPPVTPTPIRIPEPVDPQSGANPEAESAPTQAPAPAPGVILPGVRVVPIMPVSPVTTPTPATTPGGVTPGGATPPRTTP